MPTVPTWTPRPDPDDVNDGLYSTEIQPPNPRYYPYSSDIQPGELGYFIYAPNWNTPQWTPRS